MVMVMMRLCSILHLSALGDEKKPGPIDKILKTLAFGWAKITSLNVPAKNWRETLPIYLSIYITVTPICCQLLLLFRWPLLG